MHKRCARRGRRSGCKQPATSCEASGACDAVATTVLHATHRSISTTLALCAATIAGGVALFGGAVYVHDGLYTHNVYKPRDDEGKPPHPLHLEIQEAVRQEMEKHRR